MFVSNTVKQFPASSASRYRWVILASLWLVYLSFGLITASIAPLINVISEDLHLSRAAMGSALGTWALVYIGAAIPAGMVIDKFGVRRALATGAFIIGLSGILRAFSVDYTTFLLAIAVFGVGGPLISIGAPKVVSTWFSEKDRGTAVGVYMTGPAIGVVLALSTANSVFMPITGDSWRVTLGLFSSVALVAGLIWLAIARGSVGFGQMTTDQRRSRAGWKVFPYLLRIRIVQVLLIMTLLSFLVQHSLANWLPEILRAQGMSATEAGFWAAVPTLIGIVAALSVSRYASRERRAWMLTGVFCCSGAATVLIAVTDGLPLFVGLILLGAGRLTTILVMLTLMGAPQVGARHMGAASGLYFTVGETGGVFGPLMLGGVADLTGGFEGGLLVLTGLSVVLLLLTFVLSRVLTLTRAGSFRGVP
ncbi:MFS transporter [Dehalococcoidia bacterium]|nr:MFS transporter [Dehalococcoidia bacterium]